MKTPLIIITPQRMKMEDPFENEGYSYSNTFNTSAILKNGGLPVIPQLLTEEQAEEYMKKADGLVMTGGADIDPTRYGEEVLDCCGEIEYDRDASDIALLKAALKLKKPVLCICRGCQFANVYFGGTMYQDIPSQLGDKVKHSDYANYKIPVHTVKVVKDTPLYNLAGETIDTNSLHHQGIKTLGEGVIPMGYTDDGLVESWYYDSEDQWIRAYQWHPEMMKDYEIHNLLIKDFIEQCKK